MIRFVIGFWLLLALPAAAQIEIEEVTSPGGVKAWLVSEPSIPMLALQVSFRGGTALDPEDKLGVTNLMAGLLEEGTGEMDARAFREASEVLAARFSFDAGQDAVRISAQMLTANRDASLALLRRAIVEPAFNDVAVERVRRQVLTNIEAELQNPQAIAGQRMAELAFPDHPYGRPSDGTLETVAAISRDDLVAQHGRVMSRDHVVVSAVGDITAEELGPIIDALLEGLPETGAPLPEDTQVRAAGGIDVIPFPTPQSVAAWSQEGIHRDDPDFMAAFVMNEILGGGGFGSRLTSEVREKRGLTYGVYSYLSFRTHASTIGGGVASANETMAQALDVIRAEWQRMAEGGATTEEIERAKKNLTGSYALRFDGNARIARVLQGMQIDDFPIDYPNSRNDRVNAVTADDIARVARRLLDVDTLQFVVVGQPEGVQSTN